MVQVPGREVVTRKDDIGLCGGDRIHERPQWCQPMVCAHSAHHAGFTERMVRWADGVNRETCVRQSYR
jgi:hypothetical protein